MRETDIIRELEAVLAHAEDPDDAFTTNELAEMMGANVKKVRKLLRLLAKDGRLQSVKVMRPNLLNGVVAPRDAYRILPRIDPT